MRNPLVLLFWLLVLGGFLNYYLTSSSVTSETREEMKEAYVEYVRGETAEKIGERQAAFNKAMEIYTGLEDKHHPHFGTGRLEYNIANSYFQLGEYPWAVLYYHRAQALRPRDEKVQHNLQTAQKKLGFEPVKEKSVFENIFFFHYSLSLPERLQLFFAFAILALLLASVFIWQKKVWARKLSYVLAAFGTVLLLSLAYSHYISPVEGVMVQSSSLYRDAGFQYAKVVEEPVLSGRKVEVVGVLKEGKWLKVMTPDGHLGYVPDDAIRII